MKIRFITLFIFLVVGNVVVYAQKQKKNRSKKSTVTTLTFTQFSDTVSYMIGSDIGRSLSMNKIQVNENLLFQGIRDGLVGKDTIFTKEQFNAVMQRLQRELQRKMEEAQAEEAKKNKEAGKKWLEENKNKPGVIVTSSGLQYKVIQEGNGPKPTLNSKVKVHYEGKLIDGKIFDSSYDRGQPIEFNLNGVIAGWQEGLQLMPVGSIYEFYIPSELGYGDRSLPAIPAGSVLIFKVELLDIVKP
ncbi:MAG: FKBP-type peptidyl-prolyl cis-trans isomerase [Bacteroidales bacterium]|nr:FKBP-type peptidyl-prolyl cis-trans isomerase [Bacteroidales bacterium]